MLLFPEEPNFLGLIDRKLTSRITRATKPAFDEACTHNTASHRALICAQSIRAEDLGERCPGPPVGIHNAPPHVVLS